MALSRVGYLLQDILRIGVIHPHFGGHHENPVFGHVVTRGPKTIPVENLMVKFVSKFVNVERFGGTE